MLRISDIRLKPGYTEKDIIKQISMRLRVNPCAVSHLRIVKKSLDARKKEAPVYILTADAEIDGDEKMIMARSKNVSPAVTVPYTVPAVKKGMGSPVVVGFGPAGMFAALILAECGLAPVVFERGGSVEERACEVKKFFCSRILNPDTNIQFGEGGAGTFSDGKLNTGIKDPRIRKVLETFVENGAPEDILYDSKPHIGTDNLPGTVKNIRNKILSLGGRIYFNSKVTSLMMSGGEIRGVRAVIEGTEQEFYTENVILAIGHSSRDTFRKLFEMGVPMEAKAFSLGARIEHRRDMIDKAQYGVSAGKLPAADYKLSAHLLNGRGVYTFCMCPGGTVVAASSEHGRVVTNGMSAYARNEENSNSAVLVGITPSDFGSAPLDGVAFQEAIESKAFNLAGGNYNAPAQRVEDFLLDRQSAGYGSVKPTYLPGMSFCKMSDLFPEYIYDSMRLAIREFGRKLKGFDCPDAILTGPETRSSSPVRILRGANGMSVGIKGLYPCGEGAGYAGGITSAAVDGIKSAEAVVENFNRENS